MVYKYEDLMGLELADILNYQCAYPECLVRGGGPSSFFFSFF